MKNNIYGLVILVLMISLVLPACTQSQPSTTSANATVSSSTPVYGGILKIITRAPILVFGHPAEMQNEIQRFPTRAVPCFEKLFQRDKNYQYLPGLVESWSLSPDAKYYTFNLRKGIKFHDGTDFNAQAVKINLEAQAMAPAGKAALGAVQSYTVLDDYTLRVNLNQFDALLFLYLTDLYGMIASPKAMSVNTTADKMAQDHMVGTGPFTLAQFQRDISLKYSKFAGYWQKGKPYLEGIEWVPITDPMTSLLSFQKGEAHMLNGVTPQEAKQLTAEGFVISQNDAGWMQNFYFDSASADSQFANKKVREAVEYAIDKKAIANALGLGYYEAVYPLAMAGDPWFDKTLKTREYNPETAKRLLTEAGYPNGFDTQIVASSNLSKDYLVAIQNYLKAVGINAQLDIGDPGKITLVERQGWKGILVPVAPTTGLLSTLVTAFGPNTGRYKNMIRLSNMQIKLDAAKAEPDDAKRLEMHQALINELYNEALMVNMYGIRELQAYHKNVHDLKFGSNYSGYFEPQNAWLSK